MHEITADELRDDLDDLLRRVEAGAVFTVTVAARPVACLEPIRRREWVRGPALQRVWQTTLIEPDDIAGFGPDS